MLCHRIKGGAVLSGRTLVADTGCTTTLLTSDFSSLVVGKAAATSGKTERVLLGGKDHELRVEPKQLVEIPVVDVDGRERVMVEEAYISEDVRLPLLACAEKGVVLETPGQPNAVRVNGKGGEQFWVPVTQSGGVPVVVVHRGSPMAGLGKSADKETTEPLVLDSGGGVKISPELIKAASEEKRLKALQCLHLRLAHASGPRLHRTLEEKGWGGVFTVKQCNEVKCDACRILNRRKARIPAVKDVRRAAIKPGEIAFQDLIEMPKGAGGYNYVSVIVDAHSRRVAAMALKAKDEAILHCQRYVWRLETESLQVKEWRSDNGGEFANKEYTSFLKSRVSCRSLAPHTRPSHRGW